MSSFRVHIDLVDKEAAARTAAIIKANGGSAYFSMENSHPDLLLTESGRLGSQSYLLKPVLLPPQIIVMGVLDAMSPDVLVGHRIFRIIDPGADDETLANCMKEALDDHRARQSTLNQFYDLEKRYREITTVVSLTSEMGLEFDIDRLLERIVQQISDDLGFSIVSIMLIDDNAEYMTIRASRGLSERIVSASRVEIGKGVAGSVAQTGEPLLIKDIEKDPRFRKIQGHGRYSSNSLICVPLIVRDRVIGVLNGNNRKSGGRLTEHDLRLLSLFASQASLNIERARLYHNLEKQAEQLKTAYDRLQTIDRLKSDFITNVSHEYRTPVTIIMGYLELLKGSLSKADNLTKIDTAIEAAMRLSNMIDDSTDLLRLDTESTSLQFRPVEVGSLVKGAMQVYRDRFAVRDVEFIAKVDEGLPRVMADPEKMTKVIERVLDNSLKFTPPEGYVHISALKSSDSIITITIEDSGPGIPSSDMERVFERFEQSGDIMTAKPEGTGLGLPIARNIVHKHGGQIRIDENFIKGCRIILTLPVADNGQGAAAGGKM